MEATIIIYTYDRKDYILRALESAVHQTIERDRYEIIVVKGFMDEKIDGIIEKKADRSLFIKEKGHGKKLAPAIKSSTGDVIFILDDDDEFLPKKLEHVLNIYHENKDIIFVHDEIVKINDKGEIINDIKTDRRRKRVDLNTTSFNVREIAMQLRYRANWYVSCMSFRRDILISRVDQIEKVEQSIDPFLYFVATDEQGILSYIPEKLTRYRVHESTTHYTTTVREFIERRKVFYMNTLKTYLYALEIHQNKKTETILEGEINHISVISILFSGSAKKREIIQTAFNLFRSFLKIRLRSYIFWVTLSLLSLVGKRIAFHIFYHYIRLDTAPTHLFGK